MKNYKVYLSPVAEFKLQSLTEYLNAEWGEKSKQKFLNELVQSVSKIESFPESCPKSDSFNGIFKCVVSKLTSFYYRIKNDEIEIITLTDNRQNPDELLEEIRKFR
ncbi:type II toxin-antitoxin system RelE/ParE family toxin [Reichenbachiella sp.]|uniref:type II toxin-antitoxin system RelE/ParE family toxin n=1 Tax=Reichenbachiella sp. TaxID=2184521 RepID=UPI003B5BFF92